MNLYENYSNEKLLDEIKMLKNKVSENDGGVFMRMLHEIQVQQMELELRMRELHETRQDLDETRERYSALYDYAPFPYFTFDSHGAILDMNHAASRLLGKDKVSLLGMPFVDYIQQHERSRFLSCVKDCVSGVENSRVEIDLLLPDGQTKKIQTSKVTSQVARGYIDACSMAFIDVTERRIAEFKMQLTSKILENIHQGVMLTDAQQNIIAVNDKFLKTTGYERNEVIGYTPSKLKSGHHDEEFYREMNAALIADDAWQGEIWNRRKNGEIYQELANIKAIRNADGEVDCYVAIFSDSLNEEAMKIKLNGIAYYDELTGLANRSLLYDRLQHELLQSRRGGGLMAVLFMDLNSFDDIKSTHGYMAGDFVLKETAERMTYCLRAGDTLSRLEGDEFVAILRNIADEEVPSRIVERIVKVLEKPFLFDNDEFHVTASVGISVSPHDGDEVTVLLKNADTAMYMAREAGRSSCRYFEGSSMSKQAM